MKVTVEDLQQLQRQLEKYKAQTNRLEGQRDQLMKQLAKLGLDSYEAAVAEVNRLRSEEERLERKLERQLAPILEQHGEELGL